MSEAMRIRRIPHDTAGHRIVRTHQTRLQEGHQEFDRKPVTEVTGEDRHAAEVLKFNGYLSLGFRDGVIVFLKTRKADRTLELM